MFRSGHSSLRAVQFCMETPRVVWRFEKQSPVNSVDVWTDNDHAGCTRTRRSTSAAALMAGHVLLWFSSPTQKSLRSDGVLRGRQGLTQRSEQQSRTVAASAVRIRHRHRPSLWKTSPYPRGPSRVEASQRHGIPRRLLLTSFRLKCVSEAVQSSQSFASHSRPRVERHDGLFAC